MAAQDYITIGDITQRHLKRFPESTIQEFVTKANNKLEALAKRKGVLIESIVVPIEFDVKEYLLYYFDEKMSYAMAFSNMKDVDRSEYLELHYAAKKERVDAENDITGAMLTGCAGSSKANYAGTPCSIMRQS